MDMRKFNLFSKELNDCPNCKNDLVGTDKNGNYEGSLNVSGDIFERKCKCGFEISLNVNFFKNKKEIKEEIKLHLGLN